MSKKKRDSGAAFTILVGSIAAIAFGLVFTAIPRTQAPAAKPTSSPAAFSDVQVAGSLYTLDLQAITIAAVATKHSGNPTLNQVGVAWNQHFTAEKAVIARWLKKNHIAFTKDGHGMPHNFSLPKAVVAGLVGATDSKIAQTMLGLKSYFAAGNASKDVKDSTLLASISDTKAKFEADLENLSVVASGH